MAGIFGTSGVWSCGADFLPNGAVAAGGVFSTVHNNPQVGAAFARFSGKGIEFPADTYVARSFGVNLAEHISGFAYSTPALPTGSTIGVVATLMDTTAGGVQASLGVNTQGQLQFYNVGGLGVSALSSPIGSPSATGVIVAGAYNFFEIHARISATVGIIELRINGNVVITVSGNTKKTANAYVNEFRLGSLSWNTVNQTGDDIYLLDMTGAAPFNTYLGNGHIQTDGPTADSATAGLNQYTATNPQGTDFGNCANIPANTAQYNSDATVGHRMSLRFPSISSSRVLFMNSWISAEQDAAGTRAITPVYRSNGVDQLGASISLSNGSYVYSNQVSTIDPNTGSNWGAEPATTVSACEIGVETTG